jgi:hypothetical protein
MNFIMRESGTGSLACWLSYGGNRFRKIIDGMDWKVVDGYKESRADEASPLRNAS